MTKQTTKTASPSTAAGYVGKNGAELLIEMLKAEGTEYLFGITGGMVLPIFDALYHSDLKYILTRHEQGAAHMADGYARSTGKVGVVIATSGPGATNLVTGLATAHMDSVPIVAITGQVRSFLIGNDAFQEADTTGIIEAGHASTRCWSSGSKTWAGPSARHSTLPARAGPGRSLSTSLSTRVPRA